MGFKGEKMNRIAKIVGTGAVALVGMKVVSHAMDALNVKKKKRKKRK